MAGELTPDDVRRRIDDGEEFDLIDIRSPGTFEEGHIPGAENLPPAELEAAVEEREWADEVVVACYIGKSSVQAARLIERYSDADVASMAGGYEEWDGDLAE